MKLSGSHSFVLKFEEITRMSNSALEQLRTAHGVVPVSKEDEGHSWNKIASGVYGFTYTPGSSDGGLFLKQPRQSYEMHKLADGSLRIIGFATAEDAAKLDSPGAQDLSLYPEPRDTHQTLVAVPHARIASSKPLDRDDYNRLRLSLRPVG